MIPKTKLRKLNKPLPDHEFCVRHRRNSILWSELSRRHDLTEDFIREFNNNIHWRILSGSSNLVLSDDFLMEFEDKVDWNWISSYKRLESKDLKRWKNKLNWGFISSNQKLTDEDIYNYSYLLDWERLACKQKLSERVMEDMFDSLNTEFLTRFQKLSESFIERHIDKFKPYINFIARNQKLSAPFIWKYIDILDIGAMAKNSKINMNLRAKFQKCVIKKIVDEWSDYWSWKHVDPLRKNHNLKNKKLIKELNLVVK